MAAEQLENPAVVQLPGVFARFIRDGAVVASVADSSAIVCATPGSNIIVEKSIYVKL